MDRPPQIGPDDAAATDALPAIAQQHPEAETVILGLERKLDVLRAQLAACRAGEDFGQAGFETWSRLELQSLRIQALDTELATVASERDAALSALDMKDAGSADRERELYQLRRAVVAPETALQRAREEIRNAQRENIALNRALEAALLREEISPVQENPVPEPEILEPEVDETATQNALMLEAMLNSTSWRITAPLRAVAGFILRLRR
jgi:hypothetical protein